MTHPKNPVATPAASKLKRGVLFASVVALGVTALAAPASAKKKDKAANEPAPEQSAPDPIDPADLPLGSMYHVVDQIGARTLWDRGITGEGINVAVIDTGVANVPALRGADKVVALVDLSAEAHLEEARYQDTFGHGTHMSGIIAGRDPGADPALSREHPEWFLGVAPDAGLISVKVGDNDGRVDVSQVIAGVDWVTEHADELDIRVLNLSFSSNSFESYLTDPLTYAVERAWDAGIVVVVAAGNDGMGKTKLGIPANDPDVIAVGGLRALETGYEVPDWATNGNGVRNPDIGAPGAHIDSLRSPGSRADEEYPEARVDDDLFRGSGSSQAAAVTSGAAALLLDARPWMTPDQIKAALRNSADSSVLPLGSSIFAGEGLLRVDQAFYASTMFSTQYNVPALGIGSIQSSRGTAEISILGIPIVGEVDVLGNPWVGSLWPADRWEGGAWDGSHWSGSHWSGSHWSHAAWTGSHWSGSHWSGVEWSGSHWSDAAWSDSSWAGSHWSGSHWSGSHWSGSHWSGSHWSGSHWSGSHWSSAGWQ